MEDQTKEAQPSLMLKTYLNDHLAGSTGGRDLLRRAAKTHSSDPLGPELAELAEEVSQDRESLRRIMRTLRVPQQPAKIALGWAAEKLGRLKPNGRVVNRSPLSDVLELEAMRLGVEGKASCWRTLRALTATDDRLDRAFLDQLLQRAWRQADVLEALRTSTAVEVFGPSPARR